MTDADLYALCVWTEAQGEPYEGKVAVARVIANRMAQRYASDGTVAGTVLRRNQFDAFWFEYKDGGYHRVAETLDQAQGQAASLLPFALASRVWGDCQRATIDGQIGSSFQWGPQGKLIDAQPRTLLYVNLGVSKPEWALPDRLVAQIYHHSFFRD